MFYIQIATPLPTLQKNYWNILKKTYISEIEPDISVTKLSYLISQYSSVINNIFNKKHEPSSGLSSVVHLVSFGCSSQSCLLPFHRHFTAQKNRAALKKAALFFSAVRSSTSPFSSLRSSGLLHPQYRFIPFRSVNYATLHSSSIVSAALYIFSGGALRPAIRVGSVQ